MSKNSKGESSVNMQLRLTAEISVSKWDRQQRGIFFDDDPNHPDIRITESEYIFAKEIIKMAYMISDLKFEVQALKGELPSIEQALTLEECNELKEMGSRGLRETALEYYGYQGDFARVLIDETRELDQDACSGDESAIRLMGLLCRARTHEIIRLTQLLSGKQWDMQDQSAAAILDRGITEARYFVLLANQADKIQGALNNDISAVGSLSTTLMIRASEIMDLAGRAMKKGIDYKLRDEVNAQPSTNGFG